MSNVQGGNRLNSVTSKSLLQRSKLTQAQTKTVITGAKKWTQNIESFFSAPLKPVSKDDRSFNAKFKGVRRMANAMFSAPININHNMQKMSQVNLMKRQGRTGSSKTSVLENLKSVAVKDANVKAALQDDLSQISTKDKNNLSTLLVDYTKIKNLVDNKEVAGDQTVPQTNQLETTDQSTDLDFDIANPMLQNPPEFSERSSSPNTTFFDFEPKSVTYAEKRDALAQEIKTILDQNPEPTLNVSQLVEKTEKLILKEELGIVKDLLSYAKNESKAEIIVGVVQIANLAASVATGGIGAVAAGAIGAGVTSVLTSAAINAGTGAIVKNVTESGAMSSVNTNVRPEFTPESDVATMQDAMQSLCMSISDIYAAESNEMFDENGDLTSSELHTDMAPEQTKMLNEYIQLKIALSNTYHSKQSQNAAFKGKEAIQEGEPDAVGAEQQTYNDNSEQIIKDERDIKTQLEQTEIEFSQKFPNSNLNHNAAQLFSEVVGLSLATQADKLSSIPEEEAKPQKENLYQLYKFTDMMRFVEGQDAGLFELTVSAGNKTVLENAGYR